MSYVMGDFVAMEDGSPGVVMFAKSNGLCGVLTESNESAYDLVHESKLRPTKGYVERGKCFALNLDPVGSKGS